MQKTTWLSGQALTTQLLGEGPVRQRCGVRQRAVSSNAPQLRQWACSQWQCLRLFRYEGRPSVVRDIKQRMAMPKTNQPSGQALIVARQWGVSCYAIDHSAIKAGPSVVRDIEQRMAMPKTNQPSGQALSGGKHLAVSGYALDHSAIRAGPQWWERKQQVAMP